MGTETGMGMGSARRARTARPDTAARLVRAAQLPCLCAGCRAPDFDRSFPQCAFAVIFLALVEHGLRARRMSAASCLQPGTVRCGLIQHAFARRACPRATLPAPQANTGSAASVVVDMSGLQLEAAIAAESRGDMLVLFHASWCGFCKSMQPV